MPEPPRYRGSAKHKNRPTGGAKGTLCPEWTHNTPSGGYATDPVSHVWADTRAATLFNEALPDRSTGRLYATDQGLAFEAQPSGDGTWHGYPVPWEAMRFHYKGSGTRPWKSATNLNFAEQADDRACHSQRKSWRIEALPRSGGCRAL